MKKLIIFQWINELFFMNEWIICFMNEWIKSCVWVGVGGLFDYGASSLDKSLTIIFFFHEPFSFFS